jgi:TIR domain
MARSYVGRRETPVIRLFVSYRRSDSRSFAHRLHDRLRRVFGRVVFMDVSDIEPGADFSEVIEERLKSCRVLVAVIGNTWVNCADTQGKRRLWIDGDYVRLEVAKALAGNILVLPVLVNGTTMPLAPDLPDDLKALAGRNAIPIDDDRFDSDVERLIGAIETVVPRRSRLPRIAASAVAALALAALGYGLYVRLDPGHGLRLVPGPQLYANLPEQTGAAGSRYELLVHADGRTATLGDLTRTIVYTGAGQTALERLQAHQDESTVSAELAEQFRGIEDGDAIVAKLMHAAVTLPISGSQSDGKLRVEVRRYDESSTDPEPWIDCEFAVASDAQTFVLAVNSADCHPIAP